MGRREVDGQREDNIDKVEGGRLMMAEGKLIGGRDVDRKVMAEGRITTIRQKRG